jgi:hypothetical protein
MIVYATYLDEVKTFRMMPITNDCPYNEVIYDPTTNVLAIISKEFKQKPQMLPKMKSTNMVSTAFGSDQEYVREMMDTYYEYYMDDTDDIKGFIEYFALNSDHQAISILEKAEL